ncbi:MAG: signal peptidase I, partial [Firmicutes bacterium]|nr:signal peptidase I [Candidatus Caballimonas caccae]
SMNPTLESGDELVINRVALPKRGDIAVFDIEERNYWIIKRVIGIEGDTIKLEDNKVYRKTVDDEDFILIEEDYTQGITEPKGQTIYSVGEDEYFFLGDNRENSADSRYYGLRAKEDLIGVVTSWALKQEGFWYSFNKVVNYPSRWFSSCKNTIGE